MVRETDKQMVIERHAGCREKSLSAERDRKGLDRGEEETIGSLIENISGETD